MSLVSSAVDTPTCGYTGNAPSEVETALELGLKMAVEVRVHLEVAAGLDLVQAAADEVRIRDQALPTLSPMVRANCFFQSIKANSRRLPARMARPITAGISKAVVA